MAIVALILSILTLIFAIWLKEMGMKVFEESHFFKLFVAVAFALLVIGILAVKFFIAPSPGAADVGGLWAAVQRAAIPTPDLE